ncbi:unnamed protein product, partial [Linum tenue]
VVNCLDNCLIYLDICTCRDKTNVKRHRRNPPPPQPEEDEEEEDAEVAAQVRAQGVKTFR